ncbi:M64 family metallopeptidase [Segatella copri]|uniref:M64 family metallopeptidase n=1 Tax=Segatella copri TaxID=165179 RepID=UPI003A911313
MINAEGEWEVASKPDWCEVSPASGNKKTEVTLTIKGMAKNADSRDGKVVFRLKDKDYTHECSVSQYGYEYGEDEWITLQKATKGNNGGINIVLLGDGFNAKDIASGKYLNDIKQEVEYFFGIEPYKTYRDYFNVYTAIPLSTESGVGTVNTIRYNRFNTTFAGGVKLKADYDEVFDYALGAPTVNKGNLNQTLIIMVPNSTDYGGICQMWEDGSAIAFCPQSTYGYPLDTRGVIQHEAGGHGFGKLGDEYIYHNAFIDFCDCTCCGHVFEFNAAKSLGWFDNLELTGKMHSVGWSHLIFDDRYSDIVDIYEGGYMHNRGVFRSEPNSCMNNDIPYYSTISRESIVKRIKAYAGETYSFEDFVKNDKRDAGIVESRAFGGNGDQRTSGTYQHAPVFHKGSPLKMAKVRKHR